MGPGPISFLKKRLPRSARNDNYSIQKVAWPHFLEISFLIQAKKAKIGI
jgi:hypothetical protein